MFLLLTTVRVLAVLLSSPIAEPLKRAVRGTPSQGSLMGSSRENWLSGTVGLLQPREQPHLSSPAETFPSKRGGGSVWWFEVDVCLLGWLGWLSTPIPRHGEGFFLLQNCVSALDLRLCVYMLFATRTLSGLRYK